MFSRISCIAALLLLFLGIFQPIITRASEGTDHLKQAENYVDQALSSTKAGKINSAKQIYQNFPKKWLTFEDQVKMDSAKAYSDIESSMGQVDYAFLQNNQSSVIDALSGLQRVNENYINGKYPTGDAFKKQNITLHEFVAHLQLIKEQVKTHQIQASVRDFVKVRESWLSVEGTVVAQSNTVYAASERNMVTINSMLTATPPNEKGALQLLDQMIYQLTPLADKSSYTIWDAAMIPVREGLEALLVVGALLAFSKKSERSNTRGTKWIWMGVIAGLMVSIILAVLVKFVLTSGAFGNNNFLISGWTGVFAAVMLMYMSYWLHSKSNVSEWNQYIRKQSSNALSTGRLFSLGLLSFLAVFREGTETVLFLIGMVNQISVQNLIVGLLIGIGILAVVAYLMIFVGVKLPIRPFFLISSLIVFYLCLKFTGMGISSLQLAGVLPSTPANLPRLEFVAFYPSWQSAAPQIVLVLSAIMIMVWRRIAVKRQPNQPSSQI